MHLAYRARFYGAKVATNIDDESFESAMDIDVESFVVLESFDLDSQR